MKEYKLSKAWVTVTWIVAPLLILTAAWTAISFEEEARKLIKKPEFYWIFPAACGLLVLLMIYALWDAVKSRFVITDHSVFIEHPFGRRELSLNDIKGYREDEYYIYIIPHDKEQKRIRVSKYYANKAEITNWLWQRYGADIDELAVIKEEREILGNEDFGYNEEDRSARLKQAKKIADILNFGGALAGGWAFLWPYPFEISVLVAIAFPIVSALIMKRFNGLAKLEVNEKTLYAKLNWAYLGPAFGLCLLALLHYNILAYRNIWLPAILFTALLVYLVLSGRNMLKFQRKGDKFVVILMLIFLFGYGYGTAVLINCGFDHSKEETKRTAILKKRISKGKSRTYYIEVLIHSDVPESLNVPREFYRQVETGEEVLLDFRKGLLGTPWVNVRTSDGLHSAAESH